MKAIVVLLLSLISLIFASFGGYALTSNATNPFGGGLIELDSTGEIKAIEITVIKQESGWSSPYDHYPVICQDENISGTFKGSGIPSNGSVDIYISNFDASEFLKAPKLNSSGNGTAEKASLKVNSTGMGRFSLPGQTCGTYAIYAIDANTSAILSALPLIVAEGKMEMVTQSNISAGDILEINISMPEEMASNLTCAAIVVSRNDYESAKLIVNSSVNTSSRLVNTSINSGTNSSINSGTNSSINSGINSSSEQSGYKMIMSVGNNTAEMPPRLSSDSIMELFPIIPENSAISLSESVDSQARFYLMTDPTWDGGEYILTCLAYTDDKGIVGMEQKTIEVKS